MRQHKALTWRHLESGGTIGPSRSAVRARFLTLDYACTSVFESCVTLAANLLFWARAAP